MEQAWGSPIKNIKNDARVIFLTVFLFTSFIFCSLFVIISPYPSKTFQGWCSDHYSHYQAGVLFAYKGFETFKTPTREICSYRSLEEDSGKKPGCTIPGSPHLPPLRINWEQFPLPYPPLTYLYHLPETFLFVTEWMSETYLNVLIVIQYLLVAHLLLWILAFELLGLSQEKKKGTSNKDFRMEDSFYFCLFLILPWISLDILRYTLNGFYDGIGVLFVIVSLIYLLKKQNPVLGLLFYSLAVGIHFRALWLLPIGLWSGYLCVRKETWKLPKNRFPLALSLAVGLISAYSFLLLMPSLKNWPSNNAASYLRLMQHPEHAFTLGVPLIASLLFFSFNKNWLMVACLAAEFFFLITTQQVQIWHRMFMIPFFLIPVYTTKRQAELIGSLATIMLVYYVQADFVFGGDHPLSGALLPDFWHELSLGWQLILR